jgi:hypothetical protein
MRATLVTLAALAIGGSAAAEPSAPATTSAPATNVVSGATVEGELPMQGVKEPDPLVCKSETPIGSKLPVKHCVRKSERDRQKRDSQETLQLIQRRSDGPMKTDPRFQ